MTIIDEPINFTYGSMLTVHRASGRTYDKLGDATPATSTHQIGPCSIVDSHGTVNIADDGLAKWVGTVDIECPPDSDVRAGDTVTLPNGDRALVIKPPERPMNPFTGWSPFCKFTLASPGYTDARTGQ